MAVRIGQFLAPDIEEDIVIQEYVSPYSCRRFQKIAWQEVTPGWRGIYRAVTLAYPPVLEHLRDHRIATRSQLLRHFYASKENGRKQIERMARTGLLLRHSLIGRAGHTALYTLGPLGAELVHENWAPNWWRSLMIVEVLRWLVTGELYLGFSSIWPCAFMAADWPLTAFFNFGGMEYGIIVLRDDVEQVRRQITRSIAMRLIVVVERIGDAARLNTAINVPTRFILDQELAGKHFSQCALFRFEDGVLVHESLLSNDIS